MPLRRTSFAIVACTLPWMEPIFVGRLAACKCVDDGPHRGTVTAGRSPRLRRISISLVAPLFLVALAVAALAFGTPTASAWTDPNVEEWALPNLPDPSGVAYYPPRKSLLVVGDEGDIAEVSTEGKLLRIRHVGADL